MFLGVAFRAFFAALFNRQRAEAIQQVLESPAATTDTAAPQQLPDPAASPGAAPASPGAAPPATRPRPAAAAAAAAAKPLRSDALTLLATLQRETRLVDLIQEPLDQYSDAQVGAAARPCLTQCRATLKRIFELRPLLDRPEGDTVQLPGDSSPLRYQWVGDASGPRQSGKLVHPGWEASRCELAQWTGDAADAMIVAPAQLEP